MATVVIQTTSSKGIKYYFPTLPLKEHSFRAAHSYSRMLQEEFPRHVSVYTVEIDSIEDLATFCDAGETEEAIVGRFYRDIKYIHPDDRNTVEYLNTLLFVEIYDDYRE